MKSNLIALILCLCILVSIPVSANAQGTQDLSNSNVITTVTSAKPSSETTPTSIDLAKCTVTLSKTSYVYSAEEKKPSVTVKNGATKFVKDVDYTVKYANNINAGTATVTITAIARNVSLTGSVVKTFTIAKKDIADLKNKTLSKTDFVYNGKAHTPTLTIRTDLLPVLNKDYTLTYKNNVKVGFGTVTAKGTGKNYKGTITKTFTIHPDKVTGLTSKNIKDTTFTLKWNKVKGNIDGYRIYRYDSKKGSYVFAVSTKNNYFYVKARTPATIYKYKVKAYNVVNNKRIESEDSNIKTVVMRPKKAVTNDSGFKGKNFVFKWKSQKADGYEVRYSKNKNFKKGVKTKVINNKKTTSLKVKLSKKTQYYYQVRAFKVVSGKKYYGAWSDKRTTQYSNVYSKFTTYFNSPYGRTQNIKVACKHINGTILKPNDVFSFDKIVGPRTPARGFKVATVYSGQTVTTGYGGGVCQVSTTLFNAALFANLKIVERHQHSLPVHYIPYGRDAAISWGTCDLKFKNNTKYDIKISAKVINNSKVEFKLLTNADAKPKKVKLSVKSSGKKHVLYRKVSGKVNYTTRSVY